MNGTSFAIVFGVVDRLDRPGRRFCLRVTRKGKDDDGKLVERSTWIPVTLGPRLDERELPQLGDEVFAECRIGSKPSPDGLRVILYANRISLL